MHISSKSPSSSFNYFKTEEYFQKARESLSNKFNKQDGNPSNL